MVTLHTYYLTISKQADIFFPPSQIASIVWFRAQQEFAYHPEVVIV
jgi:hypothetical protein